MFIARILICRSYHLHILVLLWSHTVLFAETFAVQSFGQLLLLDCDPNQDFINKYPHISAMKFVMESQGPWGRVIMIWLITYFSSTGTVSKKKKEKEHITQEWSWSKEFNRFIEHIYLYSPTAQILLIWVLNILSLSSSLKPKCHFHFVIEMLPFIPLMEQI